jgi:hypothetical protein
MSRPRGENGQFLPKPWPLDENGKPKRQALAEHDPIAVAHRVEKPYSREAKEKRRKVTREESGTRDPTTGQIQGGIPGHQGSFGRIPTDLRTKLRDSAADRIKVLEEIADDLKASARDRKGAVDLLLRYGLGPVTSHQVSADGPLFAVVNVLNQMPAESLKRLEEMDDDTLHRTLYNLTNPESTRHAADELINKIQKMSEQIEARKEKAERQKSLPAPGRESPPPKLEQEPPELAEAVTEEPKKRRRVQKTAPEEPDEETPPPPRESYFYTQGGARVIPISEFGHVRKS